MVIFPKPESNPGCKSLRIKRYNVRRNRGSPVGQFCIVACLNKFLKFSQKSKVILAFVSQAKAVTVFVQIILMAAKNGTVWFQNQEPIDQYNSFFIFLSL